MSVMRIVLQLVMYCALFTLMVKLGVGNSALNGLFFYPKPVQEKVYALGLTDREMVGRKRKRFMLGCDIWSGAYKAVFTKKRCEENAKAEGVANVRLIDTTDGCFMGRKEATLLGLGGSTLLVGKK